ncbi:hypothetical protein RZE82_03940 [Mollicutes bacterium LVI A0039]|nr:hypothetical protein RZE82_03940 [Mollicutes bacterium LVI A0039]
MKIRILGNSCSGKTTLTTSLSKYYQINCLHMDAISFVPDTNFVRRDVELCHQDIAQFLQANNKWVIEGNYLSRLSKHFLYPDILICIDLPIEQSLCNYEKRFVEFKGKSRPELPNLIENDKQEMIDWIKSYPERKPRIQQYVLNEQLQNPFVHILHLEDMSEVIALCNNPEILLGFFA